MTTTPLAVAAFDKRQKDTVERLEIWLWSRAKTPIDLQRLTDALKGKTT